MRSRLFRWTNRLGLRGRWLLGALVASIIVLPSIWLAVLEHSTTSFLVAERDRGLQSEALLLAEQFNTSIDRLLFDDNIRFVVLREGEMVDVPDGRYYVPPLTLSDDHPVEYVFVVNLSDTSFYPERRAAHRDELQEVFERMDLSPVLRTGHLFGRGFVSGPYGPFHYVYVLDSLKTGDALLLRGAKLNVERVRRAIFDRAFEELRAWSREEGMSRSLDEGVHGLAVEMPDTTLVFATVDAAGSGERAGALGSYSQALSLQGLFPDWRLRVDYLNELRTRRWRDYLATGVPLVLVIVGVLATARLAMREVELSRVKTMFVSNVSHEMKTPLTKIGFFNEILEGLPHTAEDRRSRYHRVIRQECERLTVLIDNVLDLSRIEQGEMRYEFIEVPISEVVSEVAETFNVIKEAEGYRIDLEMDEDLPVMEIDAGAVKQALINLTDNAVKYSVEAHPIVVRAARCRLLGRPAVAISVSDQGIGIPKDKVKFIFEEFYRIESDTRRVSGSGLGLPLVRHIVEAHGGQVEVSSTVGVGSTFTMLLPVHPPRQSRVA